MILKIITLSFAGILLSSPISPAKWTQLKTKKCTIEHPEDWNVKVDPGLGMDFAIYLNDGSSGFANNINLMVQDNLKEMSFESYAALSLQQIQNFFKNSEVIRSEYVGEGKSKYFEIEYTGEYNDRDLHWLQRIWMHKGHAYILTFTAARESYTKDINNVQKVFESIHIKGIH